MPSLIATGSAPQMPMRQPDSIVSPLDSAISSRLRPSLASTVLSSSTKWTSGAPDLRARLLAIERPAAAPGGAGTTGAAGRDGAARRRGLGQERLLLAPGAQEPDGGQRDRCGADRPRGRLELSGGL